VTVPAIEIDYYIDVNTGFTYDIIW